MNPLVCQPNDGPPAKQWQYNLFAFPMCLCDKYEGNDHVAYHSMSLVSLVSTQASSKNIMAAWHKMKTYIFRNDHQIYEG